jgi:endonuclease YncB( thermonuclease family)
MAKAIESSFDKVLGHFGLGMGRGNKVLTPNAAVHDGDTFSVRASGNFGLRFLGIDTPEVSFQLPGKKAFTAIDKAEWETFLSDPFAAEWGPLPLDPALRAHLESRVGPGCAANHAGFAVQAQAALAQMVTDDRNAQGLTDETFRFFLRFATDVIDRYGRLLAYANREQEEATGRPLTYNERLLQTGMALPYFIWPNINPFRTQASLPAAVLRPGFAADVAQSERTLREARAFVAQARSEKLGLFAANGLRLEPFELRYLAGHRRPNRWVIDLSSTGNLLRHPQRYFEIAHCEDRLYIADEHVAMFLAAGWVKQGV